MSLPAQENAQRNNDTKYDFQRFGSLKVSQAAKILGISPSSLRRFEKEERITSERAPGNNYRTYRLDLVNRLKAELQSEGNNKQLLVGRKKLRKTQKYSPEKINTGLIKTKPGIIPSPAPVFNMDIPSAPYHVKPYVPVSPSLEKLDESIKTKDDKEENLNLPEVVPSYEKIVTYKPAVAKLSLGRVFALVSTLVLVSTILIFPVNFSKVLSDFRSKVQNGLVNAKNLSNVLSTLNFGSKKLAEKKSTAPSELLANVLAASARVSNYVYNVNIPVFFKKPATFEDTLTTEQLATFNAAITTTNVTFKGTGLINNLLGIDIVTKTTLERDLDIDGQITSTGMGDTVISKGVITGPMLNSNITYSGKFNFSGTIALKGTTITSTAAELNQLAGLSYESGGIFYGNGSGFYQDTSYLFWDSTSQSLGIGTSSPTGALTISSSGPNAIQINPYGAATGETGELRFYELATNGDNYTGFKAPDSLSGDLTYTLPSDSASSSDYVLTWQPSNVLQWKEITGVGGAGDITQVGSVTSGAAFSSSAASDQWLGLGSSAGRISFVDSGTDYINFSDANVGIGTTAPTSMLSVGPSSQFQVNSTGNIVMLNNVITSFPSDQGVANSFLRNDGTGTLTWADPAGTGIVGYWQRNGTNLAPTTISDYLGIGTTAPSALLEVNGTAWLRGGTAPTSGLFVNNIGNIGIGTTSPTSPLHINASATTSGTILNLAYGTPTVIDNDLTGAKFNLDDGTVIATNQNITGLEVKLPTVTNTNTTGTKTLKGFFVNFGNGAGLNQTGAGATTYNALQVNLPSLTQTAGTLSVNGLYVNSPSSITTGGTASSLYLNSTGVAEGTLYGLNISDITGSTGTERAINIGSGWDSVLSVGGTVIISGSGVTQTVGGGTGYSTYLKGDVLYADADNSLAKLGVGLTNQVLSVNAGGVPGWATMNGSNCVNCLINNPTGDQIIAPSGQDTTGLVIYQTSTSSPTGDIFAVTNNTGLTKYFYVDSTGTVNIPSLGSSSSDQLTIEPGTDKFALKLLGTHVATNSLEIIDSQNTSGTIFDLGYPAAKSLSGALVGMDIDLSTNLTATNQSVTAQKITLPTFTNTNTTGTKSYLGLKIAPPVAGGINQNGAGGTSEYILADLTMPALTQSAGTLNAYGVNLTMPSSITTGGTAYGVNINASGVGSGTLYGMNISAITPGAGSERALNIGSGWDYGIYSETTGNSYFAGNVGIGTTAPGAKLDVLSSDEYVAIFTGGNPSAASNTRIRVTDQGFQGSDITSYDLYFGSTALSRIESELVGGPVRTNLKFYTSYNSSITEKMRLQALGGLSLGNSYVGTDPGAGSMIIQGNVGIGSTAPGSKLSVAGGVSIGSTYASSSAPTSGMIIEGNVGIGTTGSEYKLDVAGSLRVFNPSYTSSNYTWVGATSASSYSSLRSKVDNASYGWGLTQYGSTYATTNLQNATEIGNVINGPLTFITNNSEKMRITSGGNVGIGYEDPGTGKLSINGNVGIGSTAPGSKLSVAGGASFGSTYAASSAPADGMIIQGNVGIGTTGPTNKLSVVGGNVNIENTQTVLNIKGTDNQGAVLTLMSQGNASNLIQSSLGTDNTQARLSFTDGGATHTWMVIGTSGNVGIGSDTTPDYLLDVQGTFNSDGATYLASSTGNVGIGSTAPGSKLSVAGGASFGSTYASSSAPTSGMIIEGNVGIGTTGPGYPLEVAGTGLVSKFGDTVGVIATGGVGTGKANSFFGGYTSTAYIGQNAYNNGSAWTYPDAAAGKVTALVMQTGDFTVWTGTTTLGTQKFVINNNGSINIVSSISGGTSYSGSGNITSTAGVLTISGTGNSSIAGNVGIGTTGPSGLLHVAGSTYPVVIDSTGELGVGTVTPTGILTIDDANNNRTDHIRLQYANLNGYRIGRAYNSGVLEFEGYQSGASSFLFKTTGAASALSISNTGNVSMSGDLTVSGGDITLVDGGTIGIGGAKWTFDDTNDDITTEGNVGIGTTGPNQKLQVAGTVVIENDLRLIGGNATILATGSWLHINSSGGTYFTGNVLPNTDNSTDLGIASLRWRSLQVGTSNSSFAGNVGIGTTGPVAKLHVSGTSGDPYYASAYFTVGNVIGYSASGNSPAFYGYSGDTKFTGFYYNSTNDAGHFLTKTGADIGYIYLKASGKVGIGEVAPGSMLSVLGGVSVGSATSYSQTAAPSGGMIIQGNFGIGTTGPSSALDIVGNLEVGGTDFFVNDSTGRVGIGVTDPTYGRLEIAQLSNAFDQGLGVTNAARNNGIYFWADASNDAILSSGDKNVLSLHTSGNVGLGGNITNTSTFAGASMVIKSGKVGIGTTSPSYKLEIVSSGSTDYLSKTITSNHRSGFSFGRNESGGSYNEEWTFFQSASSKDLWIGDLQNTRMSIKSGGGVGIGYDNSGTAALAISGNVGIGSTAPGSKLSVAGGASFGSTYASSSAPTDGMIIEGNVGIGTANPGALLDVTGTIRSDTIQPIIYLSQSGTNRVTVASPSNNSGWFSGTTAGDAILRAETGNLHLGTNTAAKYLAFYTGAGTEQVRITNTGNVGIGTTGPSNKLHVYAGEAGGTVTPDADVLLALEDSDNVSLQFLTPNNRGGYIYFGDQDNLYSGYIAYTHSNNAMTFRTNNSDAVTINSSGNVGIGTTGPKVKVDVSGALRLLDATYTGPTTGAGFELYYDTADSGANFMSIDRVGNVWKKLTIRALDVYLTPIGGNVIVSSGNVGIGTTTPTAYLNLKAGTASASTAPIKLTSGVVNTTPEAGAVEFDGTDFFITV